MPFVEATLGVDESTDPFILEGGNDIWVTGLTTGSVQLQVQFQRSSTWRDVPNGNFTTDTNETVTVSEERVKGRLTGVSNNAGVYARLGRGVRK